MSRYQIVLDLCTHLSDGRLAHSWWSEGKGRRAQVHVAYHARHMAAPLARDLDELHRHLSRTTLTFAPDQVDETPDWDMEWERVSAESLPLQTFRMLKRRTQAGRDLYICRAREDMISGELVKELNDSQLPDTGGFLRYASTTPARTNPSVTDIGADLHSF